MTSTKTYDPKAIASWFDERAPNYDETYYGARQDMHCADSYRAKHVLELVDRIRPACILDIGCGTGIVSFQLIERGYEVFGFDISPGMVEVARSKAKEIGYDPTRFKVSDIHESPSFDSHPRHEVDCVIANGVFPYIDEPAKAHGKIAAILPAGGHYIGSYANKLFDVFTLNRFTVEFHLDIARAVGVDPPAIDMLRARIRSLLTNPDLPERIPLSASNELFSRVDNPLTIRDELRDHQLELKEMRFYKFHPFAPLAAQGDSGLQETFLTLSRKLESEFFADWRAHFLCTSFLCHAQKG